MIDLDSWKELELSDKIEKIQDAIKSSRRICFSYHSPALYPDFTIEEIYPNKICVKAIVSPKHKWKLIEEYGEKSFTEQADGNLLFEADCFFDNEKVILWVLSLKDGVALLEPKELRKELSTFGKTLCDKYSESNL